MNRPLGGGITVNAKRPNPGVKSQLHTPLTSFQGGGDEPSSVYSMSGVRRETAGDNPLLQATPVIPTSGASTASPVDMLLQNFLTCCRVAPQNNYVPDTVEGLQQVAAVGDWRSVVDISGKIVSDASFETFGNDVMDITLQLRFEGLFRMKLFDDLSLEISKVLSSEMKSVKDAEVAERCSSGIYKIVSLNVLLCEIKSLTGRGAESLEQLYRLRNDLMSMSAVATSEEDRTVIHWWEMKIWNQIVNALLRQRQWHLALHELSRLLLETRRLRDQMSTKDIAQQTDIGITAEFLLRAEIIVLCRMSRLLLQIGAVAEATNYYEEAKAISIVHSGIVDDVALDHVGLTSGLLFHVQNQYEDAVKAFESVSKRVQRTSQNCSVSICGKGEIRGFFRRPSESPVPTSLEHSKALLWHITCGAEEFEGNIHAAAINNLSTSLLYLRRINDSISHLESLIQADPVRNMTDPVVFNLTTMYDLSCAHDLSGYKKKVLQSVAAIYHVYDLSYKSFRL